MSVSDKQPQPIEERRCVYCGSEAPMVWVHGHGQCANCGINVEECCRGELCTNPKDHAGIGKPQ